MAARRKPAKARPVRGRRPKPSRTRRPARLGPAEVRLLYERLRAANPSPRSELVYASPWQLLVSVILSAQATDRGVNLATGPLFRVAGTPEALLRLGEAGLARHIRTIGLWRMKAKNVIAATRLIVERHGSEVPRDRAALEALPGVGRKTANVVMNTAFGEPTIAVDTHIFRVSNRTGLAPGRNVREVEDRLLEVTPDEFRLDAHHWLILHGRYTCIARRPRCPQCPIRDVCLWPHKVAEEPKTTSSSARRGR